MPSYVFSGRARGTEVPPEPRTQPLDRTLYYAVVFLLCVSELFALQAELLVVHEQATCALPEATSVALGSARQQFCGQFLDVRCRQNITIKSDKAPSQS